MNAALLSGTERAVALFASDMPATYRYRPTDLNQIKAWIAQGAERLGADQVRADEELLRSHNLSLIASSGQPADGSAYRARFPSQRRISRAQSVAGMLPAPTPPPAPAPVPFTVHSFAELVDTGWTAV
ncbi:hypothetical protein ABZ747_35335 [Kitasatospora cineracea]|uniref:hypothetical protein n=1 Tax=Kitasatospora cineracea TaxID=88074 RepID=UPI0033DF5C76